ncbi:hypothetical protein Asp14428_42380 [Actinoplanes sp. NBRC 14428]|uniref:Uncharacterized protein n=1 Tax=Pseudosporangium ferrugineum TaxID=439699 RepID=A0A2T0S7V2_9ACTN|nr:hypothetical protein [Pseudosporangium ferrugineum]PRY29496.1 hypothetical protein CLV70_106215 [Pseudosporangium ferrugineum]BCJ52763.1 hypothetical protein Asp14428_42380 [Actinoplanes sp. NBRC 14428]
MAISHIVVLVAALTALLCLPCAVAIVACADGLPARRIWTRSGRREIRALRCLDRRLSIDGSIVALPDPDLDELAAELRRLAHQRCTGPTVGSAVWLTAVQRAYDLRLLMASETLGVPHHLASLDGMDLDLERIRVEEKLRAAGLRLR